MIFKPNFMTNAIKLKSWQHQYQPNKSVNFKKYLISGLKTYINLL